MLATDGSRHSFKLAPAIGAMVAGSIAGDAVNYADIGRFSLARFERGSCPASRSAATALSVTRR